MSDIDHDRDHDRDYAAISARDARFDGLLFVGVTTTGVYCRPICPARTPARSRCRFFKSAAEAERDGFRACLRCRPELAPGVAQGIASVDARARIGRLALAHLDDGAGEGLAAVAAAIGVSERHVRRVLTAELGVSPIEWLQTRRLAMAKQLLHDTSWPLAQIAFASGFSSVRRFNAAFRERFARTPSSLRRPGAGATDAVTLRLDYRPPLDWETLCTFVGARALPGLERVERDPASGVLTYERALHEQRAGGGTTTLRVAPDPERAALRLTLVGDVGARVFDLVERVRRMFDLDAHPAAVGEHLAADPLLAPLVARRPGLRVPGAFEPFETAVRAVLGQQVSVRAATTLAGRYVARFGAPRAEVLAEAPLEALLALGVTTARARTLQTLARAVRDRVVTLEPGADPEATIAALVALPGIGPWTASYIAMRALAAPDAFPAGDLGIKKALGLTNERAIIARAQAWRPWRAYAVMHLWHA